MKRKTVEVKLEINKNCIAIGTNSVWVYSTIKWWKEDPFMNLKRAFELLPEFDFVEVIDKR